MPVTAPVETPDAARPEIRGYHAVLEAAKDSDRYSSDLLGDRDVRDYKQIPLELDAPRHTLWRGALQHLLMRSTIEPLRPRFAELARRIVARVAERGSAEVAAEVALPYVVGCLAIIYGRPQDVEAWTRWGPDVWLARAHAAGEVTPESLRAHRERRFDSPSQRSGDVLHAYLADVFDEATRRIGQGQPAVDVWDTVARLEVEGRRPTREEMFGIASVLLAGGRDTVIKLVTGIVWHLVSVPADRIALQEHPEKRRRAIAELLRFLSPLAKMERVERDPSGADLRHVLLDFASANHDPAVWDSPDVVDIDRERRPHLAFGFGRHSCMGMGAAEHEASVFLDVLLEDWPGWELDGECDIDWAEEGPLGGGTRLLERFHRVPVRVSR